MAKTKQNGVKRNKSLRTAFIRVSAINDTKLGRFEYTLSDIEKILSNWSRSASLTYWAIEHDEADKDEEEEEIENEEDKNDIVQDEFIAEGNVHFHIVIQFNSPTPFDNIKKKFNYGKIQSAQNMKRAIQYLVHLNNPEKKKYLWESIITNGELEQYKKVDNVITLEFVIDKIDKGEIKEYNLSDYVDCMQYCKHDRMFEKAFRYYRERLCMNKNRDITVMFFGGATGKGKTTFAKKYCEKKKLHYCVSSAANDPIQDYKGEEVLILDDLRDDSYKFHEFLKQIDNHTLSSAKSRFVNKWFIGDTIIITSSKPLKDWYENEPKEDKKQLYRRIKVMYDFTEEWIYIYEYNERKSNYVLTGKAPNVITLEDRRTNVMSTKIFADMGIKVEKIDTGDIEEAESMVHERAIDDSQTRFNF